MGDWLGTGRVSNQLRQYQPFTEARAFVHALRLRSNLEWVDYCKSGKKPDDIPAIPRTVYAKGGWTGWGDWLGTGKIAPGLRQFLRFKAARAFVRALGFKSSADWHEYCRSGKRPDNIPSNPNQVYADQGWAGMGDWLGTGRVADGLRPYRPFGQARIFARTLGLKSRTEWVDYTKSGKKPDDIPAYPNQTYAKAGWAGMGDWLGTGTVAARFRRYKPFKEARSFARALELKSNREWQDYCKSGKKSDDIPANPNQTYAKGGWAGWGDWLGTGRVADQLRRYRSFRAARGYAHSLPFKSNLEWKDHCKSGKKPEDIPANPNKTYAEKGWAGWGDWLGTGTIAPRLRQFLPFNEARTFARGLGLKSGPEWRAYCQSRKRPGNIPSNPNQVYAEEGWAGMDDWLGTANANARQQSLQASAKVPEQPQIEIPD